MRWFDLDELLQREQVTATSSAGLPAEMQPGDHVYEC